MHRLLYSLFALGVTTALSFMVYNSTVFSAKYLKAAGRRSGAYDQIADMVSKQIAGQNTDPQAAALTAKLITPDFVKTQLDSLLDQTEAYLRGKGGQPKLDLSSIKQRAAALGVALPPDAADQLAQAAPSGGGLPPSAAGAVVKYEQASWIAWLVALLSLLGIVLTAKGHHRWWRAARALFGAAVVLGLTFASWKFLPSVLLQLAKPTLCDGMALIQPLLGVLGQDIGQQFLLMTIVMAALAAASFVVGLVLRRPEVPAKPATKLPTKAKQL